MGKDMVDNSFITESILSGSFEYPDAVKLSRFDPTPYPFMWWVIRDSNGIEVSREKIYD